MTKCFSLFLLLLFQSCQKQTLWRDWKNPVAEDKKLSLSEGALGTNTQALKLSGDCQVDIDIKGNERFGHIHVVDNHRAKNCPPKELPVKMQYKTVKEKLRVCSDYRDGRHTCENMVSQSF